jgi:hypothetical protein
MIKIKDNLKIKGKFRIITYKKGTKEILRQSDWIENLVVLNEGSGMNLLIKRLINNTTYDLIITQAKIGDDATPPVDGDTDLGNPLVEDIAVATAEETADDEATFEFFISDAELPDDTYEEFGIFCGEQLFARSIITPAYTKSTNEDTKIEYIISVSN